MSQNSFFQGLLSSVFERGITFSRQDDKRSAIELCEALVSGRGEASGVQIAHALFNKYDTLTQDDKRSFFQALNTDFDVDVSAVINAANDYASDSSPKKLGHLRKISETRRLELFRRLNSAPGGTERLVRMREDLMSFSDELPELRRTDLDFEYLFSSWFNRGFLVMRHIDWQTPAHILEKVISYEAVHAIDSWDDLRRRLLPPDRRCFAFFHPAMPDEPLIFVEVALTGEIPGSIQAVLAEERDPLQETEATTAVFYSISNCQKGLKGVSFGNFLIKQVANDLSHDFPKLKTFVTLSPIPGFMRWLAQTAEADNSAREAYEAVKNIAGGEELDQISSLEANFKGLAARYFVHEKRPDSQPIDPVSRFHLGNGASIRQINWLGDISAKGLKQSAGLMVNYLYDLSEVETNHEAYAQHRQIKTHKAIRALAEKNKPEQSSDDTGAEEEISQPEATTSA